MFHEFYHGCLYLTRLNYAILTLLPKTNDANTIHMYRPICLINVFIKLITEVINNTTIMLADKVMALVQTAFIKVV